MNSKGIVTYPAKHITVSIGVPPDAVYAFAADPTNLPKWASGLSTAIRNDGNSWVAESPMGIVKVSFTPKNTFGVLDHMVTLPNGLTVNNPMRVIPNGKGTEVIFTLYHLPGVPPDEFLRDAATVEHDLKTLKQHLEAI